MESKLVPPTERECEKCGREDVWNEERENWTIRVEDGEKQAGNPQCLHEWDINGTYNPFPESDDASA